MPGAMELCPFTSNCQGSLQAWSNGEALFSIGDSWRKGLCQPQATKALHCCIPSADTARNGHRVNAEGRHRRVTKIVITFNACYLCRSSAAIKTVQLPAFSIVYQHETIAAQTAHEGINEQKQSPRRIDEIE